MSCSRLKYRFLRIKWDWMNMREVEWETKVNLFTLISSSHPTHLLFFLLLRCPDNLLWIPVPDAAAGYCHVWWERHMMFRMNLLRISYCVGGWADVFAAPDTFYIGHILGTMLRLLPPRRFCYISENGGQGRISVAIYAWGYSPG